MGRLHGAMQRLGVAAVIGFALTIAAAASPAKAQPACPGDCNGNGAVVVNELVICVNIALGSAAIDTCTACDANGDGEVVVSDLVRAVNAALTGCGTPGPTPTETPPPTNCPLEPGRYTITSVQGGKLQVATFSEFDFPQGGHIIAEVGPGDANCVQPVVVPFSENDHGFTAPTFCIPALQFTVEVVQTGCGIGQMDSDGGSDYTITEVGDTSDKNGPCNLPQANCLMNGPAPDSSQRVHIKVGDGTPDTCPGGGTGNSIVAIPVFTTTWQEHSEGDICPGAHFDPPTDNKISAFPQILDFTTDATSAKFQDLDGDGCFISGTGPRATFTRAGVCMDLNAKTISTGAAGTVASSGGPLYDLLFRTFLPNTFTGPEASTGATCANPPVITFPSNGQPGEADRCISGP